MCGLTERKVRLGHFNSLIRLHQLGLLFQHKFVYVDVRALLLGHGVSASASACSATSHANAATTAAATLATATACTAEYVDGQLGIAPIRLRHDQQKGTDEPKAQAQKCEHPSSKFV